MKVNKEELEKLANKSDADLWLDIQALAKSKGFSLPTAMPKHEDIEKIRRALLGIEKIKMGDAIKIINNYKKN